MSENSFQSDFVGISFTVINLRLLDTINFIFDRIFERDYFSLSIIQSIQDRIECCRFPRSSRSSENGDSGIFI